MAQTRDAEVVAHLLEHLEVLLRSHLVKDDASDADILPEVDETREECCHRVGCRLGIDHQYHRDIQHACYLIRGTPLTIVTVEESHHPLHDADIGIGTIVREELAHMFWRGHEGIEVDAGSAAYRLVEFRVDIVGSALEGLHLIAFPTEQSHQSSGNGCLARAAGGCRYQKCCLRCRHVGLILVESYGKTSLADRLEAAVLDVEAFR